MNLQPLKSPLASSQYCMQKMIPVNFLLISTAVDRVTSSPMKRHHPFRGRKALWRGRGIQTFHTTVLQSSNLVFKDKLNNEHNTENTSLEKLNGLLKLKYLVKVKDLYENFISF